MTNEKKTSGSKTNLNESSLPLLDDHDGQKGGDANEKIELEIKISEPQGEGVEGSGDATATDAAAGKAKKEKKVKKVKEIKEKKEGQSRSPLACAQNFTVGLNCHDRDEKKINDHVNLTFEDIIGEPDSSQGFEFVWRLTFLLFNWTKFWLYRLIAAILAIPLALIWAVVFALLNILSVWGFTPLLRVYDVLLHHLHRIWAGLVRTFLDPLFQSFGLCLANIRTKSEQTNLLPTVVPTVNQAV